MKNKYVGKIKKVSYKNRYKYFYIEYEDNNQIKNIKTVLYSKNSVSSKYVIGKSVEFEIIDKIAKIIDENLIEGVLEEGFAEIPGWVYVVLFIFLLLGFLLKNTLLYWLGGIFFFGYCIFLVISYGKKIEKAFTFDNQFKGKVVSKKQYYSGVDTRGYYMYVFEVLCNGKIYKIHDRINSFTKGLKKDDDVCILINDGVAVFDENKKYVTIKSNLDLSSKVFGYLLIIFFFGAIISMLLVDNLILPLSLFMLFISIVPQATSVKKKKFKLWQIFLILSSLVLLCIFFFNI